MRLVPERINTDWIGTLSDADLIDVEARLHSKFALLERREKTKRGASYQLCCSSAETMDAWDRWSRVLTAARGRSLNPRRVK
jgi:hypothetical protein